MNILNEQIVNLQIHGIAEKGMPSHGNKLHFCSKVINLEMAIT